ncbi:MAG: hypothetical protein AAGU32_03850 [Bacillota bacterium]
MIGWQKGYTYIYECVADEAIWNIACSAMKETAKAFNKEYGISLQVLNEHIDDLLNRFANRSLGDTVERVGRDPLRKMGSNDRLIGAALYCMAQGTETDNVIQGIIAALKYDNMADDSVLMMQSIIYHCGINNFLKSYCDLEKKTALIEKIENTFVNQERETPSENKSGQIIW